MKLYDLDGYLIVSNINFFSRRMQRITKGILFPVWYRKGSRIYITPEHYINKSQIKKIKEGQIEKVPIHHTSNAPKFLQKYKVLKGLPVFIRFRKRRKAIRYFFLYPASFNPVQKKPFICYFNSHNWQSFYNIPLWAIEPYYRYVCKEPPISAYFQNKYCIIQFYFSIPFLLNKWQSGKKVSIDFNVPTIPLKSLS